MNEPTLSPAVVIGAGLVGASVGAALVKAGGRLALSGILAEQAEEVRAAYADAFDLDPTAIKDGWVRISGVKRA